MHENMREWDTVNLINCDNLRRKFYEIDPYNRYILTQREVFFFQFFYTYVWRCKVKRKIFDKYIIEIYQYFLNNLIFCVIYCIFSKKMPKLRSE